MTRINTVTKRDRRVNTIGDYQYGTTARKENLYRAPQRREDINRRYNENRETKQIKQKQTMSVGYALFIFVAILCSALVLYQLISLQTKLTAATKQKAAKERTLNEMIVNNNEAESRIERSLDLEKIKSIAIGELGMTYADQGQIVTYSTSENEYMRHVPGND